MNDGAHRTLNATIGASNGLRVKPKTGAACTQLSLCDRHQRKSQLFEVPGNVWKVRAPMDAFLHVGELIGHEHLRMLREAMTSVFGEVRPEPDPREIVRISKPSATHSEWLRDGLATNLLLIAVWQDEARISLDDGEGQRFANDLIGSLPGLSTDQRLLASLRDELPLLAEAAPLPLLSALEQMLGGDGALIRPIFVEAEGFLAPMAYHTGLLWALETLAWDPDYFDRSMKILARLAAIDPGGKIANRPINSLREVLVLWNPNTNAPLEQRLAIIDWICDEVPDVGWPLLCALLPSLHDSSTPTARPRLRDAGASDRAAVTYEELWGSQSAIIERAVTLAGYSAARWERMVGSMSNFSAQDRLFVLNALSLALEHMPEQDRQPLWQDIRSEVEKHERFSGAAWALPPDQLRPLRELRDRYAPSDPIGDVIWLFDTWIQDAYDDEKRATQRRVDALRQVLSDQGLEGVLRLGLETKHPYQVARMLEDVPCPSLIPAFRWRSEWSKRIVEFGAWFEKNRDWPWWVEILRSLPAGVACGDGMARLQGEATSSELSGGAKPGTLLHRRAGLPGGDFRR